MNARWMIAGHNAAIAILIAIFIVAVVFTTDAIRVTSAYHGHYLNAALYDMPRMLRTTDSGGLEIVGNSTLVDAQRYVYDTLFANGTHLPYRWYVLEDLSRVTLAVVFFCGVIHATVAFLCIYFLCVYWLYIMRLAKEEEERVAYQQKEASLLAVKPATDIHRFTGDADGITSPMQMAPSIPSTSYLDTTIRPHHTASTALERLTLTGERHLRKRPKVVSNTNGARITALPPPPTAAHHEQGIDDGNPFADDQRVARDPLLDE